MITKKRIFRFAVGLVGVAGFLVIVYLFTPFLGFPPIPPVPKSAGLVWSSERSYGIAYDLQVRFSAPYGDCLDMAEAILEGHSNFVNRRREEPIPMDDLYIRVEIQDGEYLADFRYVSNIRGEATRDNNRWWFRPDRIQNGIFMGSYGPHDPSIWIDKDRGMLFYLMTD